MRVIGTIEVSGSEGIIKPLDTLPKSVPIGTMVNVQGVLYTCVANNGESVYKRHACIRHEIYKTIYCITLTVILLILA